MEGNALKLCQIWAHSSNQVDLRTSAQLRAAEVRRRENLTERYNRALNYRDIVNTKQIDFHNEIEK